MERKNQGASAGIDITIRVVPRDELPGAKDAPPWAYREGIARLFEGHLDARGVDAVLAIDDALAAWIKADPQNAKRLLTDPHGALKETGVSVPAEIVAAVQRLGETIAKTPLPTEVPAIRSVTIE